MSDTRSFFLGCLGILALLGNAACGGLGPGDYRVYRIAFQEPARSEGCFPNMQIPVNEQEDSSNQYIANTWILYVGPEDRVYLDLGDVTLEGTESGDGYDFSGESVDVEVFMDPGGSGDRTETRTVSTSVTFALEGKVVEGQMQQTESFSCSGANCPEDVSCTTTIEFVGGEVKDVELQHEV